MLFRCLATDGQTDMPMLSGSVEPAGADEDEGFAGAGFELVGGGLAFFDWCGGGDGGYVEREGEVAEEMDYCGIDLGQVCCTL